MAARAILDDINETAPHLASTLTSALLQFVGLDEGGTIYANIDPSTNLPTASVLVESYDSRLVLGLDADGLLVSSYKTKEGIAPYQVELKWTPWHGNGLYVLNLQLLDWRNNNIPSSHTINVHVTGIPENLPNVKSRFIDLYQSLFGLKLKSPVFAHYNLPDQIHIGESRWVSTAYIGDHLYEINIFDNGTITSSSQFINSDEEVGFCRPSGTIRMLAVIVDYGNTGLNSIDVEKALQIGVEQAQQLWADYSRQLGLPKPVLQIQLTTFAYGAPTQPGMYITSDEIRAASGLNPADFDLLAEIDLDKNNTATSQYGGLGVSLADGCRPSGSRRTNIAFTVRDQNSLENAMPISVFQHEFIHSMGWMHWWPNQIADGSSWSHSSNGWEPYLMFGWTDVDGDGIIEIQDSTPYGLIQ